MNPDSIILNEAGAWKIFGFDFALSNMSEANAEPTKWKCSTPLMESCEDLMPDLDFLAPEFAIGKNLALKKYDHFVLNTSYFLGICAISRNLGYKNIYK